MSSSTISTQYSLQSIETHSLTNYYEIANAQHALDNLLEGCLSMQATDANQFQEWTREHNIFYNVLAAGMSIIPILQDQKDQQGKITSIFCDAFTHKFMKTPITLSCCENFFDITTIIQLIKETKSQLKKDVHDTVTTLENDRINFMAQAHQNERFLIDACRQNNPLWPSYQQQALESKCTAYVLAREVPYKHPTCPACKTKIFPKENKFYIYKSRAIFEILKEFNFNLHSISSPSFIEKIGKCLLAVSKLQQARSKAGPVLLHLQQEIYRLEALNCALQQKRGEIEKLGQTTPVYAIGVDPNVALQCPISQALEISVNPEDIDMLNVLKGLQQRATLVINENTQLGNLDLLTERFRTLLFRRIMSSYLILVPPVPVVQQPSMTVALQPSAPSQGQGTSSSAAVSPQVQATSSAAVPHQGQGTSSVAASSQGKTTSPAAKSYQGRKGGI